MTPETSDLMWQIRRIQGGLDEFSTKLRDSGGAVSTGDVADFSARFVDEVAQFSVLQKSALGGGLPFDRFTDDEKDVVEQPEPSSTSIFLRVDFDGVTADNDAIEIAQTLALRSFRPARCFRVYVEGSFDTMDAHPEDGAEQAFSVIGNPNHVLLDELVIMKLNS